MNDVLLLSIKPRFALPLIAGSKTTEVRKGFPLVSNVPIFIYASTPVRAIIGHAFIAAVNSMSEEELWRTRGKATLLARHELADYLGGKAIAFAIDMTQPVQWPSSVPLGAMRQNFALTPPQSFRRVGPDVALALLACSGLSPEHVSGFLARVQSTPNWPKPDTIETVRPPIGVIVRGTDDPQERGNHEQNYSEQR